MMFDGNIADSTPSETAQLTQANTQPTSSTHDSETGEAQSTHLEIEKESHTPKHDHVLNHPKAARGL